VCVARDEQLSRFNQYSSVRSWPTEATIDVRRVDALSGRRFSGGITARES
jgi:hypothetical protein